MGLMDLHPQHLHPASLPPQYPLQNGFGQHHGQQPPQQQHKRKGKRGKRGSGLEARQRALKRQTQQQQLGFFGQVPSLDDLRQENWKRTQKHYGGGPAPRPFAQQPHQQHGPGGRPNYRRPRKAPKLPKPPTAPTPRGMHLTPAGNPLDTPANLVKAEAAPTGADKLEAEGLQAGLDWYGTNENTALFLAGGQQMTTSDSEELSEGEGSDGEGEGEAHSLEGDAVNGGADAADANLPRHVQARLVEQEAYIAELEDQNLRLREQLEMLQQEMDEMRHGHRAPADSEEGFAEHSEGSLPGDLSVMRPHQ